MPIGRRLVAALVLLALSPAIAAAADPPPWQPVAGQLMTRWAKDVDPAAPLPEYPRPQMTRTAWQNLNGLWDYALTAKAAAAADHYDGKILVPFAIESALSGVKKPVSPDQRLFYHRTFTVPAAWAGRHVLMHFGAVDYETVVTVNGTEVGRHTGGYDPFTFDVTAALKPADENDVVVNVYDANGMDQLIGKQRQAKDAHGIWYTGCTGIWQTVWLEPVDGAHVASLKVVPDVDASAVKLTVAGTDAAQTVSVTVGAEGKPVATANGDAGAELSVAIPSAHLWTPDDPYLYSMHVQLRAGGKVVDEVDSYFAMRKVSLGKDAQGRTRILLNNQFVFQRGVLDQGYWPDGIYTAPTDAALRSDIDATKKLGFNLSRKHAKVEPDRWYYWCDTLGLLVWQDVPQTFAKEREMPEPAKQQFVAEIKAEVAAFANHPSIVVWTTFNEGWGEHDVKQTVDLVHELDPTRLVNTASGWNDVAGVGDIHDTHHYPPPWCTDPEADRAVVCGEFGGLGMRVPDHMWTKESWGYQGLASGSWSLTKMYQQLIKEAYGLRDKRGMSAFVYTQLTDVETESNGLLTYDRAVTKPDAAIVAAANAGQFVPLPPNPNPQVVPTSAEEPQAWRYTFDKPAGEWTTAAFDDAAWKTGKGGFGHGVGGVHTDWHTDDIWLRRTATLPAKLPPNLDVLLFHDEDADVYVNGVLAASAKGYNHDYEAVPMSPEARATFKPGGSVTVAVHCHQTTGGQFIDAGVVAGK